MVEQAMLPAQFYYPQGLISRQDLLAIFQRAALSYYHAYLARK